MPKLISEQFGISPAKLDDLGVFDTFVDLDSQLHVDPHLLNNSEVPEMQEAHGAVTRYFEETITLLSLSEKKAGPLWEEATRRLRFSELKGVSLGYARDDADGSAVGPVLAERLASRAFDIIKAGERDARIFELVGLFTDDYGPDRISDVVLKIAQEQFAKYTARVAAAVDLPTVSVQINRTSYALPFHVKDGKQRVIYFIPKDVLRELPVVLDRSELAAASAYNAAIRARLNELFAAVGKDARAPGKRDLWERVLDNPSLLKAVLDAYVHAGGSPYDFATDPAAEYGRFLQARKLASQHPLQLSRPSAGWTAREALEAVTAICEHFKHLVEHNGLWDSLWIRDSSTEKSVSERAMQRIFLAIALTYCRDGSPDLDIAPETNSGPGPVDFKFSHGSKAKVTVEMKKSQHGRLLHGYETQLALYNKAERTNESIFLIIRTGEHKAKLDAVLAAHDNAVRRGERAPKVIIVDARPQYSASKA